MHTSGIDQQCGHAHCKACVPGGTSAATCIHVQYKVCLAHSEKDKCTDRPGVFRLFQKGHCDNKWSYCECGQKIFSVTPNPKFLKAYIIIFGILSLLAYRK